MMTRNKPIKPTLIKTYGNTIKNEYKQKAFDFYVYGKTNDDLTSLGNDGSIVITNNYSDADRIVKYSGGTTPLVGGCYSGVDTYNIELKKPLKAIGKYRDVRTKWLESHIISDVIEYDNSGWSSAVKGLKRQIITEAIKTNIQLVDYETYMSSDSACCCFKDNELYYYNPSGYSNLKVIYVLDRPDIYFVKRIDITLYNTLNKETNNRGGNTIKCDGVDINVYYYYDLQGHSVNNEINNISNLGLNTSMTGSVEDSDVSVGFGKGKDLTSNKKLNFSSGNTYTITAPNGFCCVMRFDKKTAFYINDYAVETDDKGYIMICLKSGNYTISTI